MQYQDTIKKQYFLGLKLEFREDDLNILGAGAVTGKLLLSSEITRDL